MANLELSNIKAHHEQTKPLINSPLFNMQAQNKHKV